MKTVILALSYAFCWGVGLTLTKIVLSEITATTLLILQLLASVTFLATACYLKDRQLPFTWSHLNSDLAASDLNVKTKGAC